MTKPCSIDGCKKHAKAKCLCDTHYQRFRKYGDATKIKRAGSLGNRKSFKCSISGCSLIHYSLGMCRKHYERHRKHGNPEIETREYHGHFGTRTYMVWVSMIQRCENPKSKHFMRYGGRGISVCKEWRSSFSSFLLDMGESPDGMHIDRINNDGNYEPSNCRWCSPRENMRNRSSLKLKKEDVVFIRDKKGKMSGFELSEKYGVSRSYVYKIWARKNWSDL